MGTKRGSKQNSSGTQFNPKGVTQGVTLVCPNTGDPIDSIVDGNGITRLAVDTAVTVNLPPNLTVDLDGCAPDGDSVHIVDRDNCYRMTVNSDGSIDSNIEVDANDGDNIAISGHPDKIFSEFANTLTTANFEEIFTYTSSNSRTNIIAIECTVSTPSTFRLKINGVVKKEKRSSPAERNVLFLFHEHRPLPSGDIISIDAKVERKIGTNNYDSFTSLEGYLR